jgi:hypothetical protein
MTRKHPASTVDRSLAVKYFDKAARFKADAEKMSVLADEFSGNGVAVLCVHAAIAYGDAISILAGARKSKSGDHRVRRRRPPSRNPCEPAADRGYRRRAG